MLELVIGVSIASAAILRKATRRFRNQRKLRTFEQSVRNLRSQFDVSHPFRAATVADAKLVARLRATRAHHDALVACGFAVLGDIVTVDAENTAVGVMRAFVDRTTCAFVAVGLSDPPVTMLQLSSYATGEVFGTRLGRLVSIAEPPTVHRQAVAADLSHRDAVAKHVELTHTATSPLIEITTLDELIAQLDRGRAETARWREGQPPDALLDADLRAVLGDGYARSGEAWIRRLRGHLPQARLRVR